MGSSTSQFLVQITIEISIYFIDVFDNSSHLATGYLTFRIRENNIKTVFIASRQQAISQSLQKLAIG